MLLLKNNNIHIEAFQFYPTLLLRFVVDSVCNLHTYINEEYIHLFNVKETKEPILTNFPASMHTQCSTKVRE